MHVLNTLLTVSLDVIQVKRARLLLRWRASRSIQIMAIIENSIDASTEFLWYYDVMAPGVKCYGTLPQLIHLFVP